MQSQHSRVRVRRVRSPLTTEKVTQPRVFGQHKLDLKAWGKKKSWGCGGERTCESEKSYGEGKDEYDQNTYKTLKQREIQGLRQLAQ